jgi:hypothetical protein
MILKENPLPGGVRGGFIQVKDVAQYSKKDIYLIL